MPGQTRPIAFLISRFDLHGVNATSVEFALEQHVSPDLSKRITTNFTIPLHRAEIFSPHKVTHLHPSGIVSYAVLRPPARNATCSANQKMAPVFLMFHGAGLDASSDIVAHTLDSLPSICAWVLYPTGVSPWSGDDWRKHSKPQPSS